MKRLIDQIKKEGDRRGTKFYARVRNALWGRSMNSVKIGIKKGENEEMVTITEPDEVKEYIKEAWEAHFEPSELPIGESPDLWIGEAKRITGDMMSIMKRVKIKEIRRMID